MPSIHIQPFGGMLPKVSPNLLGPEGAQTASNVKLMSGELRAWRKPMKITANIADGCLSLYRLYGSGAGQWLSWPTDVDVVGSPLSDATDYRIYYTGDTTPRKTNYAMATGAVAVSISIATPGVVTWVNHGKAAGQQVIFAGSVPTGLTAGIKYYVSATGLAADTFQVSAIPGGTSIATSGTSSGVTMVGPFPNDYLEMGVPAPSAAATATLTTNGTGTAETRFYLVTNISTFGSIKEESAPTLCGAPITVNPVGSTVTINGFAAPPAGKYNITHRRIYRTMLGTSDFAFLAEIPVATASYADTITLGTSPTLLASTYYLPPPAGLKGIVQMPNGMEAGFNNNEVWFCEPYKPHAWPSTYMQVVDYPIVGLGVYGSALVVLTTSIPYVFYGSHPSAMTMESVQIPEPCISKRSIAQDAEGVIYASPNGIASVGPRTRGLVTEYAYTRDEWQAINPSYLFGKLYGRNYIGFNASQNAAIRTAQVIPRDGQSGVGTLKYPATAFYVDRKTGETFMVSELDGLIYQLDADTVSNSPYEWKSKVFSVPQPVGFTCLQVNLDTHYLNDVAAINAIVAQIIAANQVKFASVLIGGQFNSAQYNAYSYNGSNLQDIPSSADARNVTVTILADGVQVFSKAVYSIAPCRISAGYKAYDWEVIISGNVPVRSFAMATSIGELKQT